MPEFLESEEKYYAERVEQLYNSDDPESAGALEYYIRKYAEIKSLRKEAVVE